MSKMKGLVVLLTPLLITGCAAVKHNYTPQTQAFSVPDVGETATTSIGDRMLVQGVKTEGEAIRVGSLQEIGPFNVQPGVYRKSGQDANFDYFAPVQGGSPVITTGMFNVPDYTLGIRISRDGGEACVIGVVAMTKCGDLDYKKTEYQAEGTQNFQQTLVYSGKVGDKINVTYREYSGNMAREAFDNRVEYDLSESDLIGYKGARLQVLEADNSSITYEVISAFN